MWQTQNKFVKQVNLVPNMGGYFIGGGGTVSSLGTQKISLFWNEFCEGF